MTSSATVHMKNQAQLHYFGKAFTEGTPLGILDIISDYAVEVPMWRETMTAIARSRNAWETLNGHFNSARKKRKWVRRNRHASYHTFVGFIVEVCECSLYNSKMGIVEVARLDSDSDSD